MNVPDLSTLQLASIGFAMFVVSTALAIAFVVVLPRDYFANRHQKLLPPASRPVLRLLTRIAKNTIGWLLILLGLVFATPGMPGEGILIVLIGVVLIDFPGKSRIEQRIIRVDWVRKPLNRVRAWFHRSPLQKTPTSPCCC